LVVLFGLSAAWKWQDARLDAVAAHLHPEQRLAERFRPGLPMNGIRAAALSRPVLSAACGKSLR
jgi:hypothetical protein